ncbi:MAG: hypothetical protein HOW73_50475 [Polyangiaceae bacterium]|nr:hypothetical protein [Polyangiaceae bacterium]
MRHRSAGLLFVAPFVFSCASPSEPAPSTPEARVTTAPVASETPPEPTAGAQPSAPAPPPDAEVSPDVEPLPEGFVWGPDASPEAKSSNFVMCGDLRIESRNDDIAKAYEPYVRVFDKADKKIYEAHGRRYPDGSGKMSLSVDFCGDLTGDGVAELFLTERTMGAHCCYTHYVVSMTTPTKNLLMWEKGDGGFGAIPKKLRPGREWQIVAPQVFYPPFKVEEGDPVMGGYASAPILPTIFDLSNGAYKMRTLAFPDALRAMLADDRAKCKKRSDCQPDEITEWLYLLMTGDWDKEKNTVVPDAELRKSLVRRSGETRKLLATQLGS